MRKPNVTEQLQQGFKKIIRHRSYCLKKKINGTPETCT